MTKNLVTSQMMWSRLNSDTELQQLDEFKTLEIENCCSNNPIYEISYYHIPREWLVCNSCMELDFFKIGIKEKVRIMQ